MCGIAGCVDLLSPTGARNEAVRRMIDTLKRRGPDHTGVWSDTNVTLGHARLAIIDPLGGAQPMVLHDSSLPIALTYGGEIYNFIELRQALKDEGQIFYGASDTEVLLRGYLAWGLSLFSRCRGMFAAALWDGRRSEIHLVRDPLGIKPLYFATTNSSIIFGSELKSIFAHGTVKPRIGQEGLLELLGLWPYKTPGNAIYDGICEVLPAEIVTWRFELLSRRTYWALSDQIDTETSFDDAKINLREMLKETVVLQLRSDVPVSFAISGGVDSTSICGLAREQMGAQQSLTTFSVGFNDPDRTFVHSAFRPEPDEPFIECAVKELKSDHTHVKLSETDVHSALDRATIARDLPDTGDMDASLLLLFGEIAKNGFRVTLVGEGADELFGGYPWYGEAKTPQTTFPWRKYLCFWPGAIRENIRRHLRLEEYVGDRFAEAQRLAPKFETDEPALVGMRNANFFDLTRFLPGQLERMDRASMTNGVEVRVPYCDQELIQYVWRLPMTYKAPLPMEKYLLREALSGIVGDTLRLRAKASYPTLGGDLHESFLISAMHDVLEDKGWQFADILDTKAILDAMAGRRSVPARRSIWIGRIVSFYRWSKIYEPSFSM
jgi:asparagine synthase (glutamine-hydrolysing)